LLLCYFSFSLLYYSCLRNTTGKYTKTSSTRRIFRPFIFWRFVAERHIIQQKLLWRSE